MTLGIWTNDTSLANLAKLREQGFSGLSINPVAYTDKAWIKMFEVYQRAKELGFNHFLIQVQSIYPEYHDGVLELFKDCQDVEFLFGEPFDLVEKQGWSEGNLLTLLSLLNHKIKYITRLRGYLFVDLQLRLWNKITWFVKVPSSYFWQRRVWYKGQPFCWIYGQLAWHSFIPFIGSSCYKRLKRKMDSLGIQTAYLYQGDTEKFCNLLNSFFRKRFVKVFGEKK